MKAFPIKLKRPLVIFDIEATGLSPRADRIVALAAIRLNPDGTREEREWLLNPTIKIPDEVIAIHKITNERVANCPTFADEAWNILMFFNDCDLGGFATSHLDVQILQEEFLRCGIQTFAPESRAMVDAQKIFHKREPRDLTAAMKFYCGQDLGEDAHDAMNDARASLEVLIGQFERYQDLPLDVSALDVLFNPRDSLNVDRSGRWRWVDGDVTVNFGKRKGAKLRELASSENKDGRAFLKWISKSDFPDDTRTIAEQALQDVFPQRPSHVFKR